MNVESTLTFPGEIPRETTASERIDKNERRVRHLILKNYIYEMQSHPTTSSTTLYFSDCSTYSTNPYRTKPLQSLVIAVYTAHTCVALYKGRALQNSTSVSIRARTYILFDNTGLQITIVMQGKHNRGTAHMALEIKEFGN